MRCFVKVTCALLFLFVVPLPSRALSLTFSSDVAGRSFEFTVYGNVFGTENILWSGPTGTIWNDEWQIPSVSSWAQLPSLVPSSYPNNENSYGQLMVSDHLDSSGGLRYHELTDGSSPSTLERWSHEIDIRPLVRTPESFESLLNVSSAFSYFEITAYAQNYTPDSSTEAIWTRQVLEGTLTLTGYDFSIDRQGEASGVPDIGASNITLALIGFVPLLWLHTRKRRSSRLFELRKLPVILGMAIVSFASTSNAALINGGFETGDFTGWQTIGSAQVVGAPYGTPTYEGNFMALLSTGEASVPVAEAMQFLGIAPDTWNHLLPGLRSDSRASAIMTSSFYPLGDYSAAIKSLSNGGTLPHYSSTESRYGWAMIINEEGRWGASGIGEPATDMGDSDTPFNFESSGWGFPSAGDARDNIPYTIAFLVIENGADLNSTGFGMLIDNVKINSASAVPEDGSTFVFLACSVVLLASANRATPVFGTYARL